MMAFVCKSAYVYGMYIVEIRTNTNCVEDKIIRSMALKIGRALEHTNVRGTTYQDELVGTTLKTIHKIRNLILTLLRWRNE